ncbi:hypothetical protein CUU66_17670 [Peribacillus deserti]|uniref:Uncharacterized protein n=1 Tax=Peribacillus deserti TaxID=673318 RepID=A0A2N5M2L2_9BACI|nr:hypothetical protein CUU66_17670 [Peribacillus deserti]
MRKQPSFSNFPASPSAKAAILKTIKQEDNSSASQKHQIVQIPDSPYTLVIFDSPHKIGVFKTKEFLGKFSTTLETGFNLYESTFKKDANYFVNNKLVYGLTTIPEGRHAYVNHKKIHVFPLEKYFSSSRYAWDYKNLYFFYLNEPIKVHSYQPISFQ